MFNLFQCVCKVCKMPASWCLVASFSVSLSDPPSLRNFFCRPVLPTCGWRYPGIRWRETCHNHIGRWKMKEKKERSPQPLPPSCSSASAAPTLLSIDTQFSRSQVLTCSRSPDSCQFIVLWIYRFIDGSSISSSHLLCEGGFLRFCGLLFLSVYRSIGLSVHRRFFGFLFAFIMQRASSLVFN